MGDEDRTDAVKVDKLDRATYEEFLEAENKTAVSADDNLIIVEKLCRLIKRNKNLLHLKLEKTNLNEYMIWKIGSALSRAPSLISIHLTGNPGITIALKKQLHTRIRCITDPVYHNVRLEAGFNDDMKFKRDDTQLLEQLKIRQEKKNPILDGKMTEASITINNDLLTFERVLGHK